MAGKSPEELEKDLRPEATSPRSSDARDEPWYRFIQEIEDLLATGTVNFARETLEGIQETVEQTRRVTEGQRRAVANIEDGAAKARTSRRYEGFSRRW